MVTYCTECGCEFNSSHPEEDVCHRCQLAEVFGDDVPEDMDDFPDDGMEPVGCCDECEENVYGGDVDDGFLCNRCLWLESLDDDPQENGKAV